LRLRDRDEDEDEEEEEEEEEPEPTFSEFSEFSEEAATFLITEVLKLISSGTEEIDRPGQGKVMRFVPELDSRSVSICSTFWNLRCLKRYAC
jgi:hypothetical protein